MMMAPCASAGPDCGALATCSARQSLPIRGAPRMPQASRAFARSLLERQNSCSLAGTSRGKQTITCAAPARDRPREGVQTERVSSEELNAARQAAKASMESSGPAEWEDRYGNEPRKGADILVQALEREGVGRIFAYPGGASMEIHQALTRSPTIRNILCRHEQGEIFAAEGYGKVTGEVGVCIATSGPGATNLVTGLADALLDSVPMVAITGQVPRRMIGTDAFQETPIVEVTRQITKHNYLVMDIRDLPRVVKEAFYLARTGRPGPVLIDVPKDVQQQLAVPDWDVPMAISGYMQRLPQMPSTGEIQPIVDAIHSSRRPVLYVGGGCLDCPDELRELVARTGIPVAQTLMGLGAFPESDPLALQMLGMHGTVAANYAVDKADLLLAIGVRFDDRVTGKLEAFAARARIVHIDIDPAEINKNKASHITVCANAKPSLQELNRQLDERPIIEEQFREWVEEVHKMGTEFPLMFPDRDDVIMPQWAVKILHEETKGDAIITTGVGQHQMWAAQYYKFDRPRQWATSGGLGSMGFGLPSALGAAIAFDGTDGNRPKKVVVDIDGDGSFLMNCQELATAAIEKMDIKMFILNNQHLGMVVQWEDRFYKANRAHTYLGLREKEFHVSGDLKDIYPDFVMMANAFGVKAKRVSKPEELRPAIQEMLALEGPYLLDIMVPHIQHVLPMIPGGGSFTEVITTGDGLDTY